jgi:glutamate formiminotransferase
MTDKIIECVPNFSEGRDREKIERIVNAFRGKTGVKLLDYSSDGDHNRMVVTAIGEPDAVCRAVVEATGIAIAEIDLNLHSGQHPRIGAADVIPFIPLRGMNLQEADTVAKNCAAMLAENYALPIFLYEYSASAEYRRNLAEIRKGGFEGLAEKMKLPEWKPDFGESKPHKTAGAAVVGARKPLIAFNVNLDTDNLEIAKAIARKIRFSNGGLPFCKALGMELKSQNKVQVSMNLTDYTQTSIYQVVEAIKRDAAKFGVSVAGSELIGLLPLQALTDVAVSYLGLSDFSETRILEMNMVMHPSAHGCTTNQTTQLQQNR